MEPESPREDHAPDSPPADLWTGSDWLLRVVLPVLVAVLFIGVELGSDLSPLVALLFIGGMFSLIAGLVCFLREISLATSRLEDASTRLPSG